jgi:hypothetical protein
MGATSNTSLNKSPCEQRITWGSIGRYEIVQNSSHLRRGDPDLQAWGGSAAPVAYVYPSPRWSGWHYRTWMPSMRRWGVLTLHDPVSRIASRPTYVPAFTREAGTTARTRSPVGNPPTTLVAFAFLSGKARGVGATHLAAVAPHGGDQHGNHAAHMQSLGVLAPIQTASSQWVLGSSRVVRFHFVRPPVPVSTGESRAVQSVGERPARRSHRRRVAQWLPRLCLDVRMTELGGGARALGVMAGLAGEGEVAHPVGATANLGDDVLDLQRDIGRVAVGALAPHFSSRYSLTS